MHILPCMGVWPGPLWRNQLLERGKNLCSFFRFGQTAPVVSAKEEELFEDFDPAIVLWIEQWAPQWNCAAMAAAMPAAREAGADSCLRCPGQATPDLGWESLSLRPSMPTRETRKQARDGRLCRHPFRTKRRDDTVLYCAGLAALSLSMHQTKVVCSVL